MGDMRAFVYSLDGFIALLIVLFAVQMLLSSIGTMTFREPIFFQTRILASDLATIVSDRLLLGEDVKGLCEDIKSLIPKKYSFMIKYPKIDETSGAVAYEVCEREGNPRIAQATAETVVLLYDKYKDNIDPSLACSLGDLQLLDTVDPGAVFVSNVVVKVGI